MPVTSQTLSGLSALGASELQVSPLTLGTNVFGWTIDQAEAFAVLDEYVELGGNSIDTADVYSFWGDGNAGGEAETIIGNWLHSRKRRDELVIATKIGAAGGRFGVSPDLSPAGIRARVIASLERLQCERVELLYLHAEDPSVEVEVIAETLCQLTDEGLVQHTAVSNYSVAGLQALHAAVYALNPEAVPIVVQPHWSLVRREVEAELLPVCRDKQIGMLPYWGLEKGFLTGKYRDTHFIPVTARQQRHRPHELYDLRGHRILAALDEVAEQHQVSVSGVALAWLLHQDQVASVVASARTPQQLKQLAQVGTIELSPAQLDFLTNASSADAPTE